MVKACLPAGQRICHLQKLQEDINIMVEASTVHIMHADWTEGGCQ